MGGPGSGGVRPNAGRKPKGKIREAKISVTFAQTDMRYMKEFAAKNKYKSLAELIRTAVLEYIVQ